MPCKYSQSSFFELPISVWEMLQQAMQRSRRGANILLEQAIHLTKLFKFQRHIFECKTRITSTGIRG